MTDSVTIALIGAAASFAASLLAAVVGLASVAIGKRNEAHIAEAKTNIVAIEKNTNSMKDALVEATKNAAFGAGLKQGTEAEAAKNVEYQRGLIAQPKENL